MVLSLCLRRMVGRLARQSTDMIVLVLPRPKAASTAIATRASGAIESASGGTCGR